MSWLLSNTSYRQQFMLVANSLVRKWFVHMPSPLSAGRTLTFLGVISKIRPSFLSHTVKLIVLVRRRERSSFSASSTVVHSSMMRRKARIKGTPLRSNFGEPSLVDVTSFVTKDNPASLIADRQPNRPGKPI